MLLLALVAEAEEKVGNGDVDGADLVTRAAEGRGLGQVGKLGEFFAREERCEHGAYGAGINAAVGVSAGLAVDGAHVEARAAADAAEDLAAVAGEHVGAAVVDENHMHLLRPVGLCGRLGAADELGVNRELLGGGGTGKEVEEESEVAVARQDFFDADERDMAA